MAKSTFKLPTPRHEAALSVLLGIAFAATLFVLMALAQMLGEVEVPATEIVETSINFTPPEIEELEEELPPPPEEEPPPELEAEPPQLSLAQLDIALNPGTGGSIAGDFAMPTISATSSSLGTEDFVDFSDLDQVPRPMPGCALDIPRRLKRRAVSGRVVLFVQLSEDGNVLDARVESSNVPDFDPIVLGAFTSSRCRFTPPTKDGTPVRAQARLPIPIKIAA